MVINHGAIGGMIHEVHNDGCWWLPSGKLTFCYGKSLFSMGKSTISMAIFNSKMLVYQRVHSVAPIASTKIARIHAVFNGFKMSKPIKAAPFLPGLAQISNSSYPLVNVYITMENHHAINGKTSLFLWPCSSSQTVSLSEGHSKFIRG